MQDNIIVKPSVEKQFDRFLRQGRVLFFSAPCGFGKTAVAEALLSSREVLRLSADSAGSSCPLRRLTGRSYCGTIGRICRRSRTGMPCAS